MNSSATSEAKRRIRLSNPCHLLAVGFGSGLVPWLPGTTGTLAAMPLWYLFNELPALWYGLVLVLATLLGVYLCQKTSHDMGVHDHGAIVWDEFVGIWITFFALPHPYHWHWLLAGFVLFRLLDMWKPWPIRWFDNHVHGGLGIMLDDIIAGLIAAVLLYSARCIFI